VFTQYPELKYIHAMIFKQDLPAYTNQKTLTKKEEKNIYSAITSDRCVTSPTSKFQLT